MTKASDTQRLASPHDIVETIHQFRMGEIDLAATMDRLLSEIHDLPLVGGVDIGALEDRWTDIEVILALASEAGARTLDSHQAADVHQSMDAIIEMVSKAL